jgi:hypothetical protein
MKRRESQRELDGWYLFILAEAGASSLQSLAALNLLETLQVMSVMH